jgi:hypothetical protein
LKAADTKGPSERNREAKMAAWVLAVRTRPMLQNANPRQPRD